MMFIGIDNGLSGGIVMMNEKQEILHKFIMPTVKIKGKTEYDVKRIVEILNVSEPAETFCVLEKSHVRPISGKKACFNTGYGYGLMQGILECIGIGYIIISPQKWMKEILGDTMKDKKGSILFCQRRWPNESWRKTPLCKNIHDGLTDSAAIALFGLKYMALK